MSIKEVFAMRLKEIRKQQNLTQEQLAELVNVASRHISFIETGKSFPSADLIERICSVLHIKYQDLFTPKEIQIREEALNRLEYLIKTLDEKRINFLINIINNLY